MSRALFGTDGVRGLAGQYPLDHDGAVSIGRAVCTLFAEEGQSIVIAGDPRESSATIIVALTEGLVATGVKVINIGVLPTPGLAYITRGHDEFVAGVMVTASHNPYQYNGVKVFDANGDKLPDETEAELNQLIEQGTSDRGQGQAYQDDSLITEYEDFLVNSAGGLDLAGMSMAVDMANGAASGLAERVFTRLGANVTPLSMSPDGKNINDKCGATNTTALAETVTLNKLSIGVALDGDADRLMLVDELGREVNGDHIMYLLAVSASLTGVVATVMSNLGFEQSLEAKNIKLDRVKVGDRYVLEGLSASGDKLGGEQSGHIILPELLKTGDGILAAVQVVKALASSSKTLAQWRDEVKMLPQALVNIELADKAKLDEPRVKEYIEQQTNELAGNGRILIRPSGTEPLARVMVESAEADAKAQEIAAKLKELVS